MSPRFTLSKEDLVKIGKGALIALGGALLTYIASTVGNVDFGSYTPLVVAISGVLVNAGQKFLADCK